MKWLNPFRRKKTPYWDLIAPYWERISIYDGPEIFLAQFSTAPEASQNLFATHWAQSEARNGGLSQLFFNSTGVLVPEAVAGFKAIGMPLAAAALGEAMSIFGEPYPRKQAERELVLETAPSGNFPKDYVGFHRKAFDFHGLGVLDTRFGDLMSKESGGFIEAANRYALERTPEHS